MEIKYKRTNRSYNTKSWVFRKG